MRKKLQKEKYKKKFTEKIKRKSNNKFDIVVGYIKRKL